MKYKTLALLAGLALLAVGGYQFFTVPMFTVTFINPHSIHTDVKRDYQVNTYIDNGRGLEMQLSFTATPYQYVLYKLGMLQWTVWEVYP